MQETIKYTVINNRVSPATIELLIRERNKGKTFRQLGQMSDRSHERVRRLLAKHDRSQVTLLAERAVASKLGYPLWWLIKLRKEGIVNPIKRGFWLYSEEQVRQIPSLIAEERKCQRCGKPRPPGSHKFCRECRQYRKKERDLAWQKANPERWNEIQSRARRKSQTSGIPPERQCRGRTLIKKG